MQPHARIHDSDAKPAPRFSPRATWAAVVVLIAAGLAAYHSSFDGRFLFDDLFAIVKNTHIRSLWPPGEFLAGPGHLRRPVLALSLALNHATGGLHVTGYHAVNLAIHVLAALALFGVVRRTLSAPPLAQRFAGAASPLALAVALLWLVHPLQTQAVTYVVQRCESQMGLFVLLALYAAIRAFASPRRRWWMAASVASCLLAAGTKEVAAAAPLLILLWDRTFRSGAFRTALRRHAPLYVGLAASWLAFLPFAVLLWMARGHLAAGAAPSPGHYALTQTGVIVHYLRLAFWPAGLCLDYAWPVARSVADVWPQALLVLALLAATLWAAVRRSPWAFLGAWFFLILAPSSSFIPIGDAAFEHRMYLPLAAVVAAVVVAGYVAGRRLLGRRALAVIGCGLVVAGAVALGSATAHRNRLYHNPLAMWRDVADKRPENPRARYNVAILLLERSQAEQALDWFHSALHIRPDYIAAHAGLADALDRLGRYPDAEAAYRRVLADRPDHPHALNNLAWLLATCPDDAVHDPRRAVHLAELLDRVTAGRHPEYLDTLAVAYAAAGRFTEAVATGRRAALLADRQGRTALAARLRKRIDHYRAGRSLRRPDRSPEPQSSPEAEGDAP